MGDNMKKKMAEYQNALEEMSSEAVEYVRGIPVVKTFGQSVFSFKRFRDSIKKYEKWTVSYTKDLRIPMMGVILQPLMQYLQYLLREHSFSAELRAAR